MMAIRQRQDVASAKTRVTRAAGKSQIKGYTGEYQELLQKGTTSQQLADPFDSMYNLTSEPGLSPLEPVYSPNQLARLLLMSSILRQCVEALVVNIESYGYTLEYVGPEGNEEDPAVIAEKHALDALLTCPAPDQTLRDMRERRRWDLETYGNAYFEIIRNKAGLIVGISHVPGSTMRMTARGAERVPCVIQVRDPTTGEYVDKKTSRYFRTYVQKSSVGKLIYFKEFGDPRPIDPETGRVSPELPLEDQATEIYHFSLYAPGVVYGLPRWIGQITAILGSRESEMVNLNFFRENAIPAMSVLVSGGALTEDSFNRIENYINAVKGRDAMQRVMVLEAVADESAGSTDHSAAAPKIDMKPMVSERQQDGLFQDYDQKNSQKVRSAFRLPPIYVGRAEDYTRASAYASMLTAEQQIFLPERSAFDDWMNMRVLTTYKARYHRFKSLGPAMAEPESLAKMITAFGKEGALTPNAVIKIANQMLDLRIESVKEDWGDYPFAILQTYAQQGIKIKGFDEFLDGMVDGANSTDTSTSTDIPVATDSGTKVLRVTPAVKALIVGDLTDLVRDLHAKIDGIVNRGEQ